MDYLLGTPILDENILRRFKDEDNDVFIEVRGVPDVLFRVTEGNRVYYKIEKSKMKNEELTLIEDRSEIELLTTSEVIFSDLELSSPSVSQSNLFESEEFFTGESSITLQSGANDGDDPPKEFYEGQVLPPEFRSMCEENDYKGYNLRYKKFFYMMDSQYRIEIKTTDAFNNFDVAEDFLEPEPQYGETTVKTESVLDKPDSQPLFDRNIELNKGDSLPPHFRDECETDITGAAGYRVTIGDYLYILDSEYVVIQKMKFSVVDTDFDLAVEPPSLSSPVEENKETQSPVRPSDDEILIQVNRLIKTFHENLDAFHISAGFFIESVFKPSNREVLVRAYNGNLAKLNDDTREADLKGETVILREFGFNLFKAVLIHELYIKTTLAGRGDKMKYFLTHIAAAQPDGSVSNLQDNLPQESQKKYMEYFESRADYYTDKTEIIKRVYRHIRPTVHEDYKEMRLSRENIRFDAFIIAKLYEHTTRLDRGSGITIIRLTRDILDFESKI